MKKNRNLNPQTFTSIITLLLLLAGAIGVNAQTLYLWNTTTTPSSWNSSANWTPSGGPGSTIPGYLDTAAFTNLDITATTTVTLDGNQLANQILFGDTVTNTAFGWVVSAGTPSTSTLTMGGAYPMITVNALGGASIANITAPILATNLTIAGPGVFNIGNISASTVISGLIVTNGATVEWGSGVNFGVNTLTFTGSGLVSSGLSTTYTFTPNTITNKAGVTSSINTGGRCQLGVNTAPNDIGGSLTLNISALVGSPSRVYMAGTWQNSSGSPSTLNFVGTSTTSYISPSFTGSGGNTAFNSQLTNTTFNFSSSSAGVNKIYMNPGNNSTGNTFNMGALSGSGDGILTSSGAGPGTTYSVGMLGTSTTFAGQFQGDCSLTKIGTGTLTLSGNSTNGASTANAVTVSGGSLMGVTGGSFMTPVLTVANAATFGVQAASTGGQWLGTNMVFQTGSSLVFNFGALPASATTPPLQVLGNLTVTNVNVAVFGGKIAPGTYPLVKYGALVSGTTGLITPAITQPAGLGIALSNGVAVNTIYMIVTNAAPYVTWATNSQTWDVSASTNWINYLGSNVVYQQYQSNVGDPVWFGDYLNPYAITVTLNTNVAPSSVVFSNLLNTYTLSGSGQISGAAALTVSGTNTLTIGTANTYTGGTVINSGTLQLTGTGNLGTGQVTLNGGTLYQNGDFIANTFSNTPTATSTLQYYNGSAYTPTLTMLGAGTVNLNITGAGVFTAGAPSWTGFSGTVNVTAGIRSSAVTAASTYGSSNATWNLGTSGGIYQKYGNATVYLGAVNGSGGSALASGNTANGTATTTYIIGGLNTTSSFGGVISDNFGGSTLEPTKLIKVGTGALILTNVNTYTGSTIISNGLVEVDGQITSSPVTNYAGTTLAGTGALGGVVVLQAGSTLAPGVAGAGNYGTLACNGGLIFNGGTNGLDISTTNSDLLQVSGGLYLAGGGNVVLNILNTLTNGTYPLISYGSSSPSSGTVANLHLFPATQGSKSLALIDNGSGYIQLQVTTVGNKNLVWASPAEGAANNNWDVEADANWTNSATQLLDVFDNGDTVTFNNFGAANSPVNLPATVAPTSVVVSGTNPYEFSGAGKISGSAQLTVSNYTSTLTLDTFNDYSGATVINSGTVQVGDGTTLGTSLGTGPVTNNSMLIFYQPDTNAMSSITGTGNLTAVGGGRLTVTGNATYTGKTLVDTNSTLEFGSGGASLIPPTSFTVTNGGTVGFNLSGALLLTNGITGPGALSLDGPATVTLAGTNPYLENTWVNNGLLKLGTNNAIPNGNTVPGSTGWLVLDGGSTAGTVDLNGYNQTVNAVSGLAGTVLGHITNSAASGTNVLTINTAVNAGYAGVISDNTNSGRIAVVEEGSGIQTLSGPNAYTGGTTIYGTLAISQAASIGTGMITMMGGTLTNTANLNLHGLVNLTVSSGNSGIIDLPSLMKMPDLYGAGMLGLNVTGTAAGSGSGSYGDDFGYCANFSGTLNVTGAVSSAKMVFNYNNSSNGGNAPSDGQLQNAIVNLYNGVSLVGLPYSAGAGAQIGTLYVDSASTLAGGYVPGGGTMTYTIGALGSTSDIEGTVANGGNSACAIIKVGSGKLILNGSDTYTGNTTVGAGSMVVGGSSFMASSPLITVSNNATLDVSAANPTSIGNSVPQTLAGSGVVTGNVSVANSAIIPGGVGAVGTLSFSNNLALTGNATNTFNIPASGAYGQIVVAGTFDISGSGNLFNINPLNTAVPVGTYTLVTFASSSSLPLGNISSYVTLGGSIVGQTRNMTLNNTGTSIQLVVGSGNSLTWVGDGSANKWDLTNSPDWSGGQMFYQDDSVTFDDTATNLTVNITGALAPSSITVGSSSNYVFTSTGKISGGASITKSGTGTLTIASSGGNDYSGQVSITAGTLIAGTATALGSTNGVTVISGTGALDVGGQNLGAEPVTVSGAGSGNNGAILNSGAAALNALQYVTLDGDATFGGPNRWDIRANTNAYLAGNNHNLTKVGTNDIYLVGLGNTSLTNILITQGRLGVQDSTLLGTNGTLTMFAGSGLDFWLTTVTNHKSITLTNATISSSSGTNVFGGNISLNGTGFFTATTPLVLNGVLNGTGGLVQNGAGSLTLTNVETYTGNTVISNGILALIGGASIAASTNVDVASGAVLDVSGTPGGLLTLASSQTLKGNGTVNGSVMVPAGATVSPGENNTGALTVTNNITLAGNTYMEINKAGVPPYDQIVAATNNFGGTLTVTNINPASPLALGDAFKLFKGAYAGSFAITNLPALVAGLVWTNTLSVNGYISVVAGPTVNTNPTNLVFSVSNNVLSLSWPADHTGWRLLVQTNNLAAGVSSNTNDWTTVAGSTVVNQTNITMNPALPTEFYQMVYP